MINKLICNKSFDKKEVKLLIEWFLVNFGSSRTMNLLNKIKFIGFKYSTNIGISLSLNDLETPTIKKLLLISTQKTIEKYKIKKKLGLINQKVYFEKSNFLWNNVNVSLNNEIIKNFKQKDILNSVYLMISSGARGNLSQIKQIVGLRGLMSNPKGEIVNLPIKANLKEGLNSIEYFISCYGARKGLIDTALKTANSGYLTRRLIFVAQNIIIKQRDCKSKKGILLRCRKNNKKSLLETKEKLLGRILSEDIILKKQRIFSKGQDICIYIAKKIIQIEKNVYLRSSFKCNLNIGICQLCYGWDLSTSKIVKIGEPIGVLAAQSIGEPGTQLTMRTFHTGGIFTSKTGKLIQAPYNGEIQNFTFKNTKLIKTIYNENAYFINEGNSSIVLKLNQKKASKINIPRYSILFIKPKQKVYEKEIIAEIPRWKTTKITEKYNEIKSNFEGKTHIRINLKKKQEFWILKGKLIKQKTFYKELLYRIKPFILYKKKRNCDFSKLKKMINLNVLKKKYIYIKSFEINKKEKYLLLLLSNKEKTYLNYNKRISKFIKKEQNVKAFFKKTYNQGQILQEKNNLIQLHKASIHKVNKKDKLTTKNNVLINNCSIIILNLLKTNKTKDIVEGLPKIDQLLEVKKDNKNKNNLNSKLQIYFKYFSKNYNNEKATRKAIEKIQQNLTKKIQKVYKEQNVNIARKHIEIIIKQMTSKVIIKENKNNNLLKGDIVDLKKLEKINSTTPKKIKYEPLILGISKVSLLNDSFISSASFQETIRILTKSAIMGKLDWLKGLKENVILGNLIPIGTAIKTF